MSRLQQALDQLWLTKEKQHRMPLSPAFRRYCEDEWHIVNDEDVNEEFAEFVNRYITAAHLLHGSLVSSEKKIPKSKGTYTGAFARRLQLVRFVIHHTPDTLFTMRGIAFGNLERYGKIYWKTLRPMWNEENPSRLFQTPKSMQKGFELAAQDENVRRELRESLKRECLERRYELEQRQAETPLGEIAIQIALQMCEDTIAKIDATDIERITDVLPVRDSEPWNPMAIQAIHPPYLDWLGEERKISIKNAVELIHRETVDTMNKPVTLSGEFMFIDEKGNATNTLSEKGKYKCAVGFLNFQRKP